jgi:uncharacterized protein (DUF697 family)
MTTYTASFPVPVNIREIINTCTAGLGAVGVVGGAIGPGADLLVIGPVWVGMTVAIADAAGITLGESNAKKIAYAAATGVGSFAGGAKIASTVAGWILALPTAGASLLLCIAGNAALNAKLTHAYGTSVAQYFLQTHDIDDSDLVIQILLALIAIQIGMDLNSPYVTK